MGEAQRDTLTTYTPPYGAGLEVALRPPKDVLAFRREFVIKMGWFDESHIDDSDRYDDALSTVHLTERDANSDVLSGMRLTKINSLDESLSIDMLQGNPTMQTAARKASLGPVGVDVHDLTRLVHRLHGEPEFDESITSILKLFGAGLAMTMPEGERDLVWVFTTTRSMKQLLDASGIKNEVIAQGKIDIHDEQDSYFCAVHPISAMQFLRDNQAGYGYTYDIVNAGFMDVADERTLQGGAR